MNRRTFFTLLAAAAVPPQFAVSAFAQGAGMTRVTAYAFSFKALKDGDIRLSNYVGKPILIVNTASLCGYTPQYTGLQALWTRYRDKGLMIIAVPSNDFGGQEPGGEAEIEHTTHRYAVSFPVADKASVKAPPPHPFYKWGRSIRRAGIFTNIWSVATDTSRRFSPARSNRPTRASLPRSNGNFLAPDRASRYPHKLLL
jgi:glutathione peroxidase